LYVPTKIFFTKGVGRHKDYLSSFEAALRSAGIEICNLVAVSSIFPPDCKRISREEGVKELKPGQYGYLSEYHPFGVKETIAGDYAEDLAAQMLATTLGVEFNPESDWNEREQEFKMSGKIVKTFNVTQSAEGDKTGLWTTVIAAAILLP
jgi:arginine decarboxylase